MSDGTMSDGTATTPWNAYGVPHHPPEDQRSWRVNKKQRARRIERVEELLRVAENIPTKNFDMGHWYETNCKSSGCLMGHCAMDPFFTKRGIYLEASLETAPPSLHWGGEEKPRKEPITNFTLYFYEKGSGGSIWRAQGAARHFFDIYNDDVEELFMWASTRNKSKDKRKALGRIRKFLKYIKNNPDYGDTPSYDYEPQWI